MFRHASFYCTCFYYASQMLHFVKKRYCLQFVKLKRRPFISKKSITHFTVPVWNQTAISLRYACILGRRSAHGLIKSSALRSLSKAAVKVFVVAVIISRFNWGRICSQGHSCFWQDSVSCRLLDDQKSLSFSVLWHIAFSNMHLPPSKFASHGGKRKNTAIWNPSVIELWE